MRENQYQFSENELCCVAVEDNLFFRNQKKMNQVLQVSAKFVSTLFVDCSAF